MDTDEKTREAILRIAEGAEEVIAAFEAMLSRLAAAFEAHRRKQGL